MKKSIKAVIGATALLAASSAFAVPTYLPSGPQVNVNLSDVVNGGWTQCYAETMSVSIGNAGENVLNACSGDYLMMAGRETGSNSFLSLAAALFSDTIIDTGSTSNTHLANGSNLWFSSNWSWGFTAANDTVSNNQCDTSNSPTSMCLHTINNVGGYRINDITGLNGSTGYEKVFFVADRVSVPEPTGIALFGLALLGLRLTRKTK